MNPNDPAFPLPVNINPEPGMYSVVPVVTGLSKREYFSALAMQGLAGDDVTYYKDIAHRAIEVADALITELSKEKS